MSKSHHNLKGKNEKKTWHLFVLFNQDIMRKALFENIFIKLVFFSNNFNIKLADKFAQCLRGLFVFLILKLAPQF